MVGRRLDGGRLALLEGRSGCFDVELEIKEERLDVTSSRHQRIGCQTQVTAREKESVGDRTE